MTLIALRSRRSEAENSKNIQVNDIHVEAQKEKRTSQCETDNASPVFTKECNSLYGGVLDRASDITE